MILILFYVISSEDIQQEQAFKSLCNIDRANSKFKAKENKTKQNNNNKTLQL